MLGETYMPQQHPPTKGCSGARVDQKAHRVAQHLYEAGDRNRAAEFFAMSGRQRLRSGQLESAVRAMLRALDLSDLTPTQRQRALRVVGRSGNRRTRGTRCSSAAGYRLTRPQSH